MLVLASQVAAEEPPPRPGLYTDQTLIAVEGVPGPTGNLTDQLCSVTIMREGERLVATSSFLPGARVTLAQGVESPHRYWGTVGGKAKALVVWSGDEGQVIIATHTVMGDDGRPARTLLGIGTYFRECMMTPAGEA